MLAASHTQEDSMRRVSAVLFAASLSAAISSTLSAQQSIYMLVDSIKGDQPAPHDREFKLSAVSFASTNASSVASASTGTVTGKAVFAPVKVSMRFHPQSFGSFNKHLAAGTKLPSIEIRHYNSTNKLLYKTVFESVYLSSVATAGSDEAVEELEFNYLKVKWFASNDPVSPPQQVACWDIVQNRSC